MHSATDSKSLRAMEVQELIDGDVQRVSCTENQAISGQFFMNNIEDQNPRMHVTPCSRRSGQEFITERKSVRASHEAFCPTYMGPGVRNQHEKRCATSFYPRVKTCELQDRGIDVFSRVPAFHSRIESSRPQSVSIRREFGNCPHCAADFCCTYGSQTEQCGPEGMLRSCVPSWKPVNALRSEMSNAASSQLADTDFRARYWLAKDFHGMQNFRESSKESCHSQNESPTRRDDVSNSESGYSSSAMIAASPILGGETYKPCHRNKPRQTISKGLSRLSIRLPSVGEILSQDDTITCSARKKPMRITNGQQCSKKLQINSSVEQIAPSGTFAKQNDCYADNVCSESNLAAIPASSSDTRLTYDFRKAGFFTSSPQLEFSGRNNPSNVRQNTRCVGCTEIETWRKTPLSSSTCGACGKVFRTKQGYFRHNQTVQ